MPSPPAGEPQQAVQNQVLMPQGQPNPQPQANLQENRRGIRMTSIERIGVQHLANEFRRRNEGMLTQIMLQFENPVSLETIIYMICKEIDSLQSLGHPLTAIVVSNPLRSLLLRRLAETASVLQGQMRQDVAFHQLPFDMQMFYMNLCTFVLDQLVRA